MQETHMIFIKNHFVVILAFILPLLLIGGLAISTYLPSMLLSTKYDFVYATCGAGTNFHYDYEYGCEAHLNNLYTVENGKLLLRDVNPTQDSDGDGTLDVAENYVTRLFLHDTKANEGREITLQEAQSLDLNKLITSPDGVSVESGYSNNGDFFIFFDGSSRQGYYLTKGSKKSKLNLVNDDDRYYYRDNFKFIGWESQS